MENRLPTGPGSRGGSWHDPEYRRAYQRAWRAEHPEYRERERLRRARKRAADREAVASARVASFTDTLVLVVAEDVSANGVSEVARRLGVGHRAVGRWMDGTRRMDGDGVDAVVAAYGIGPIAVLHGLAMDDDVARRRDAARAANFRGRNQHTTRSRMFPADNETPSAPRNKDAA